MSAAVQWVSVAVGIPSRRVFTYSVPEALCDQVQVGCRVRVRLHNRRVLGYVVGRVVSKPSYPVKPFDALLEPQPLLPHSYLRLTRWLAAHCGCGWGESIETGLPQTLRTLRSLAWPEPPNPVQSAELAPKPRLLQIDQRAERWQHYVRAMRATAKAGRAALLLLPEVKLLERMRAFLTSEAPELLETCEVLHGGMSLPQRRETWLRLRTRPCSLVMGLRSAVLAPICGLGLIVIEDEANGNYQGEEGPRFHARTVALARARIESVPLILGAGSVSVESYYRARRKQYELVEKPRELPAVSIVDMRGARAGVGRLSPALVAALENAVQRQEQSLLLVNRRGFAGHAGCQKCGHRMECPRCAVLLTYHYSEKRLICHHCAHQEGVPERCPECDSDYVRFRGLGTEKVESELRRWLPEFRVARLDVDVLRRKGAMEELRSRFERGEIDVLLGTQLLLGEIHSPRLTLAAVLSLESWLNWPDFRAAERSFHMLDVVRAQLAVNGNSKVLIQTYSPDQPLLKHVQAWDFLGYYREELETRRALGLPPAGYQVSMQLRGKVEKRVESVAEALYENLSAREELAGGLGEPHPGRPAKVRDAYRWELVLRGRRVFTLQNAIAAAWAQVKKTGVHLSILTEP
ncbi:MAG: primosomal protein N' [Candidatus Omnitrophica bacterium]|nr:primosomal protein N' [Candidatus Omnitrophota bacterium]